MKINIEVVKPMVSINQAHFARKMGMDIFRFRRRFYLGEVEPTEKEVQQLADVLGLLPEELAAE